jgi:hypothetical protein
MDTKAISISLDNHRNNISNLLTSVADLKKEIDDLRKNFIDLNSKYQSIKFEFDTTRPNLTTHPDKNSEPRKTISKCQVFDMFYETCDTHCFDDILTTDAREKLNKFSLQHGWIFNQKEASNLFKDKGLCIIKKNGNNYYEGLIIP